MNTTSATKSHNDSFESWASQAYPLVYEIKDVLLQEVFEKLGANMQCRATYLIPDLQRPYVWDSKQVTNLLDSLLKGWPFGQIVLAQTGDSTPCFYPRSFYRTINRMGNGEGFTMSCPSDEATIVLDGQQRLQSLFLALAPNSGGLIQDQRQWMEEYHPAKAYDLNWGYCAPTAWLALNTENLASAFEVSKGKGVLSLDYSARNAHPILEWVFKADNVHSHMLQRRQAGLPPFLVNPWTAERSNRHVLLGDLWLCQDEKDVENKAVENSIPDYAWPALKAFAEHLNALKKLPIPALRIVSRKECGMDESVYNHMILSIFTRLNAAGTKLTDEDITFAWIKRYWPQLESGLRADEALKNLKQYLTWKEIDVDSLSLVRLLANFWTMIHREGKSLENEDFLDGLILRQVAEFLGNNWGVLQQELAELGDLLKQHELKYHRQYYSLDGFSIVAGWMICGRLWAEKHQGQPLTVSKRFGDTFGQWLEERIDRFILACQWSNGTGNYWGELSKMNAALNNVATHDEAETILKMWFEQFLTRQVESAKQNVKSLNRRTYAGVSAYTTQLWCWQRLTRERAFLSERLGTESNGVTAGAPSVDHCVAYAFWEDLIAHDTASPKGSDVFNERMGEINQIGNCNVLCKALNSSKNKQSCKILFEKLGLSNNDAACLEIEACMFDPVGQTPSEILRAVKDRTERIRKDLCQFLEGKEVIFRH